MLFRFGEPSPLTASQPGVAKKPLQLVWFKLPRRTAATHSVLVCGQMLLPCVMSLKVSGCWVAILYSSGLIRPSELPVNARDTSLRRAMKPAHSGAETDEPPCTLCLPFTTVLK